MKTSKSNEQLVEDIKNIIKQECDGTFSDNINDWNIASPSEAPKVLLDKIENYIYNTHKE